MTVPVVRSMSYKQPALTIMFFSPARHHVTRSWLPLLLGTTMLWMAQLVAAQSGTQSAARHTGNTAVASVALDLTAIQARIAVVTARTDISAQERDLVLRQLNAAATLTEATGAARKAAAEYAAGLRLAQETIAGLNAESLSAPAESQLSGADDDPVRMRLMLASLQTEAVSLRSRKRDLEDLLQNMASRPEQARAELADFRRQLSQQPATLSPSASPLLLEASGLREDATRQELSARIDKTEQELLSLPTRVSIATAQRDLSNRRITQVDAAIAALNMRITERRKRETEKQALQEQAFASRLAGQPAALQAFADQNAEIRVTLQRLSERLDQARDGQQKLQAQQNEFSEVRKNAEQILAIGRISDEAGPLLRDLQADLPARAALEARTEAREDATVIARVQRLQTRQQLRNLQEPESFAKRFLDDNKLAESPSNIDLMASLVERRRAALVDLDEAQGQLIAVLSEAKASDVQLVQDAGQLRSLLSERLLWLPSAAPLGSVWLRQLGTGITWLATPSNWFGVPTALASTLRTHGLTTLLLLAIIVALFAARRRLATSFEAMALPVGSRDDSFRLTLGACVASLLLALNWPFLLGAAGWMLRASGEHGGFVDALGEGLITVAIVWYMIGVFIEMCRPRGVFIAHFGSDAHDTRRLGRALRLLLVALAPTALLMGMARASGRAQLHDGIGRLAFMFGSLALALFLYRAFRYREIALTDARHRDGWAMRTRNLWFTALVAIPLLLAGLAAAGYFATAGELQSRMFTSGWVVMVVLIVYYVAMRGVVVASRRTAWGQADERRAKDMAQTKASNEAGDVSETLNLQNQAPEIDAVAVSQQTRALLRAASFVVLLVLLSGIWGGLVPALSVFNDIALWSQVVTSSAGDTLAVITLGHVLLSLLVLLMTFIAARNLPGFLEITVLQRLQIDPGTRYAISTIGRYTIIGIGLTMAFNHIGADWSQLKWIVAALGVGLGFGLQEIVANFVSGLIILFERPVRVGDLVSIGATTGTVSRIKIRAITITDFDNFEVIVPNKSFITETVQNWSLTSQVTRLLIKIGVAYGSDVEQVQKLMLEVATANPQVLPSPAPSAYFVSIGASQFDFELRVFVATIDQRLSTQHELHVALNAAFKQAGIEMPFPQQDVYLRSTGKD